MEYRRRGNLSASGADAIFKMDPPVSVLNTTGEVIKQIQFQSKFWKVHCPNRIDFLDGKSFVLFRIASVVRYIFIEQERL